MSVQIAFQQAVNLLEAAVEDRGADYIYPRQEYGCIYFFPNGKPGCIVGWVLDKLGITAQMADDSGWNEDAGVHDLVRNYGVLDIDLETEWLLNQAQCAQDTGACWADAVRDAKNYVNVLKSSTPPTPSSTPEEVHA